MRILSLLLLLLLAAACDDGFRERGPQADIRYCGNGRIEPGEGCDDGNTATETCAYGETSCVVCNATCQEEPGRTSRCGDGIVDFLHETCDDGNAVTEACPYGTLCDICDESCQLQRNVMRYCGDGVIDAADGEHCDDGAANSDTEPGACRTDCRPARCGDEVVDPGEECEPALDERCRESDCRFFRCGDGVVDPGEACDPASGAGDGCRENCVLPHCGDGILDEGEACDDGAVVPVAIEGGPEGACILDREGGVRCFGGSERFRNVPPSLAAGARSLTVGSGFACAISAAEGLHCWGDEPLGGDTNLRVLLPPSFEKARLPLRQVSAGATHACALDAAGKVECWGRITGTFIFPGESGWAKLRGGRGFSCALSALGRLKCFGTPTWGLQYEPSQSEHFTDVAAGRSHFCATRGTGEIVCGGKNDRGQTRPPAGAALEGIVVGEGWSCGLDPRREIVCWGQAPRPPEGAFDWLAAVGDSLCAVRGGELVCVGADAALLRLNADRVPGACRLDCSLPVCGDGVVDPGEDCDDGNTTDDGNGCSADCQRVGRCGDGVLQAAVEQCDDGNAEVEFCDYDTSCAVCGATCTLEPGRERRCGDAVLDTEESCDDGSARRFVAVDVGFDHGCGVRPDGRIACWGHNTLEEAPDGRFTDVKVGADFACALDVEGTIRCWGASDAPAILPPAGRFTQIDATFDAACGVRTDGSLACWGAIAAPPAGTGWRYVAVGSAGACAIGAEGALTCWGGDGVRNPPAGRFVKVAVGDTIHAAMDEEGKLVSWGPERTPPPDVPVIDFAAGESQICLIDRSGFGSCFGPLQRSVPAGTWRQIRTVYSYGCGIDEEGVLDCWGPPPVSRPPINGQLVGACPATCVLPTCGNGTVEAGETCDWGTGQDLTCAYGTRCTLCSENTCNYIQGIQKFCGDGDVEPGWEGCDDGTGFVLRIGRGEDFTCVIDAGDRVRCWGRNHHGQSAPPFNAFFSLGVGQRHVCATDQENLVHCWGANDRGQLDAPAQRFNLLAAGRDFTCGRRSNGALACWGDVPFVLPVTSEFWVEVGAGDRHLCARTAEGLLSCWGENDAGQATPPPGWYQALAVGTRHGCAILQGAGGGAPVCWGDDSHGQASPPPGLRLQTIAAGSTHTCGWDANSSATVCWGAPPEGAELAPPGKISHLTLSRWGKGFSCGRVAGPPEVLACWGSPGAPEAVPPPRNDDDAPDACRSDCQPARCGDGVLDTGEACDDGNGVDGDGCSASCALEAAP